MALFFAFFLALVGHVHPALDTPGGPVSFHAAPTAVTSVVDA
jgi:hypothetical protein